MATKKTQGFDLNDLKPTSDTIVVELKHPITDEPLLMDSGSPMSVTVMAPYSAGYKKVFHDQANKRIQRNAKKAKEITYEEIEEGSLDLLSRTTVEWSLQLGGSSLAFSQAKAKEIYSDFFWIKDQVLEAQGDLANFMKS